MRMKILKQESKEIRRNPCFLLISLSLYLL